MLPLNTTPCPQSMQSTKVEEHELGRNPVHCADCLKYCNVCVTILRANPGMNQLENQQVVFNNADYLVKNLTLEEHYLWMRRAEALAAGFGLLYQQRIVKERIPNPKQAQSSADFAAAVREQKNATRPKKERKLLDDRGKAIETFTKIGISLADATRMVDEQMSKEGRNPGGVN